MRRRAADVLGDEGGFTLIELMISMTILSLIIVPVIGSFLIGMIESTSSRERVADSSTAQLVSAYILSDIQSSATVSKVGAGCMSTGSVLGVTWTDPGNNDAVKIDYVRATGTQGDDLLRYTCINGASPTKDDLAHDLAAFDVTCYTSAGAVSSDCSSVLTVKVHVKAQSAEPSNASSYGPFEFEFDATRRTTS